MFMHLTNFSVNKNSIKFSKGEDETGGKSGTK